MTHPFPTRRSSDLINWTTQALTADGPAFFGRYWLGAQPWENHELYWSRSPLSLVGNVETPTMVVVGAEDYRTPVSESEQYYTPLRLRGVPTAIRRASRRESVGTYV